MSIENAIAKRAVLLERLGKSALNLKHPKEFELYIIALELIDANNVTLKYFIFPVNPSNLDETNSSITNIKKTATGVVTLTNSTFVPIPINLSGTFGRKFRILLGGDYMEFLSSFTTDGKLTVDSLKSGVQDFFDDRIKTGFGCLNVLKDILSESDIIDDKGPRTLILHNLAFGSAFVVKVNSIKTSMSQESNMLHNYAMTLTAIAPLDAIRNNDLTNDRKKLSTTGYIQTQTDRLVQDLTNIKL